MNKKVGIFTMFRAFNYGAVLQAYATQKYISKIGYKAEIVDYCNEYEQNQIRTVYKEGGRLSGYVKTAIKNIILRRIHYCRKGFGDFEQILKSKQKYNNYKDLDNINYDILVAGSDQIWNPRLTNGLDEGFLLLHGHADKLVSIASSMGSTELNSSELQMMEKALSRCECISVREEFAKKQLENIIQKPIKVLLDPVFLLQKEDWEKFASKSRYNIKQDKYIVTYFIGQDKSSYREHVQNYTKKMKLPLWTIQYSNYSWKETQKKLLGLSIEDFLAVIKNAELVITDSFHGVAFSLIFQKDFVALTNTNNPIRVKELLTKVELIKRCDLAANEYTPIDYSRATELLYVLVEDSRKWVEGALETK